MAAKKFVNCKIFSVVWATVLIFLSKASLTSSKASSSKSIITTLDARWHSTPLLLEASEYLAADSNENFWKFVDLSQKTAFSHNSDEYQHIFQVAGKLLAPLGLNFLKFSLSLRYYSPRVELFNKVAHELPAPDCEAFIQLGSQAICGVAEAVAAIKKAENVPLLQSFEFDHHYPKSENKSVAVVLYGKIGSRSFRILHQQLEHLAKYENVDYVLRHYIQSPSDRKIRLSGYGVELAVKKTEYKAVDDSKVKDDAAGKVKETDGADDDEVEGFLFGKLRKLYPELKDNLEQFRKHLKESAHEMAPLKVWQLQDLSFQAAQRVMSSDPQGALKVLRDISQNLPMQTRSLVKTKVKEEMRKEIQLNQKHFAHLGVDAGDSALMVNGLSLPIDELNPFQLLDLLRDEALAMDRFASLGIKGEYLGKLVSLTTQPDHESFVLDARHDSVVFINDLEKDRQYWGWPSDLQEILRPTFPGMMRYIAKNIFTLVFFVDPLDSATTELLKLANELIQNSFPLRFGVSIVANVALDGDADATSNAAIGIARAFHFIASDKDPRQAFDWLLQLYDRVPEGEAPSASNVMQFFTSWYGKDEEEEVFGEDSEFDENRKSAKRFFDKTGFNGLPRVILNGVEIDQEEHDNLEEAVIREVMMQTGPIQHAVFSGSIYRYSSVYEYIMSQPNVVTRVNSIVQSLERPYIDLTGSKQIPDVDINDSEAFAKLDSSQMISLIAKDLKYFTKEGEELSLKPVTNWVIADLANKEGRSLVKAALEQMKSSTSARVGLIHNPAVKKTDDQPELLNVARTVEAVLASKSHVTSSMLTFIETLLDENNDFNKLSHDSIAMEDILAKIPGLKADAVKAKLSDQTSLKGKLFSHQLFCSQVVNLHPGQPAVITNGRVLGPLAGNILFTEDDFKLLENFDMDLYARKVRNQVDEMQFDDLSADDDTSEFRSDIIMKASSALISREKRSRQEITFKEDKHSVMQIGPNQEGPSFDVVVIVDPLSKAAQKIAPILTVLQNVTNVNFKIAMNSREKLSELPVNRFYRYVLEPQLTFDKDGALSEGPFSLFSDMPESVLLTMGIDTPLGWMVEAVYSPYDLDNIKLQDVEKQVVANFELEYIFIEGHCSDFDTRQPPRGLQFTLGTPRNPAMFDTIVMANLGYFQLKAYPGAWTLRVREGRSAEIYDLESVSGSTEEDDKQFTVVVDSFIGKLLKVKVKRKPGMERKDLLGDPDSQSGGIWDSLSSIVGSDSKEKSTQDETINVFSVASGHLYERFLRIMMLTVMKNTKNPVKFWFLKNFLSPSLTAFLPHMAKEYRFEYELVQYHWPHWLHAQTEKQRTIWGYKILFLDVLFPLHVKKIIFVDADLIVRADLKELNEIELHGAPYAYTPFCSSRTEMDGFRFWNSGYWRSHLGGRPYHISALYVVDLDRFRRLAAGDRLRGQYQGLSQDPNSLSNLDQDLPNNMIHQVPIRSLPQEWLWCETWCDDASKSSAKAIDLCNNPMTKEPKLKSAVRIVKEWQELDNEVRRLQESVATKEAATKENERKPIESPRERKDEL
ncbi:UDP-glucose:glycoprotein glucosyltransferase 1-like [Montipora capricornis]|uniref:UDP-glucose:glycoprotein glucosyltransferase 1-like n=1 Tax=Montipora capricornis TaxID=246305 RepID=UPI0035F1F70C